MYPDGHMWYTGGWWMMIIPLLLWLLVLAGLLVLIVWFVRRYAVTGTSAGESPVEIIKKRYARGEINREEYERMKQDIA